MKKYKLIGLDIGGTQIKAAAFSSGGKMLQNLTCPTNDHPVPGIPPYAESARQILSKIAAPEARIGIATPGLVAADSRSIASQPGKMHGIEKLDWTDFLQRKKIVPLLNDAHAALLGEVWQGAAKGRRHAILLTLGTGVGGAILSDGKLLKGAIGRAGHFGHVSINEDDDRSIFGMTGSLEAAIGNYNVAKRTGGRFPSSIELEKAYVDGDADAARFWLKSIKDLARAVASFINVIDPEVVIIGGGVANSGKNLFEPFSSYLNSLEWQPAGHHVPIVPAKLGEWAGTYGAAWNASNLIK